MSWIQSKPLGGLIAAAIADMSLLEDVSIIWRGKSYPAVRSTLRRGEEIVIGGRAEQITASYFVEQDVFPKDEDTYFAGVLNYDGPWASAEKPSAFPQPGDVITEAGVEYRILRVTDCARGVWRFEVRSVDEQ